MRRWLALTLRSRESRPGNKFDLFFLDPSSTSVWDAVTADDEEFGIVIPQACVAEQLPVVELATA